MFFGLSIPFFNFFIFFDKFFFLNNLTKQALYVIFRGQYTNALTRSSKSKADVRERTVGVSPYSAYFEVAFEHR